MAQRSEYLLWPGPNLVPDADLQVGWGPTANGAKVVHSPSGHEWTLVPEDQQDADIIRLRQGVIASSKINLSQLTASSADGTTDLVASRIWASMLKARVIEAEKITANMIDVSTLRVGAANITSLDAGVITTGVMNGQRIAAGSITAAQLAAGSIKANSGIIDSIDASAIKVGKLTGAVIDVDTLRGKELRGGVVTSGPDEQNEIRLGAGTLQAKSQGKITGRLTPSAGLEVVNPRTGTLQSLSPLVFGSLSYDQVVAKQKILITRPAKGHTDGGTVQVSAGITTAVSDRFKVLLTGMVNADPDGASLMAPVRAEIVVLRNGTPVWRRGVGTFYSYPHLQMALPTGLTPGQNYDFRVFMTTSGVASPNFSYTKDTEVTYLQMVVEPM